MYCRQCGEPVDESVVYENHQTLIDELDSGMRIDMTDLEESIYFMCYCAECIEGFKAELLAESS